MVGWKSPSRADIVLCGEGAGNRDRLEEGLEGDCLLRRGHGEQ